MVSYQNPHSYNGRYRALVIDDKDPLFRMRVKVRIPDLMVAEEDFVGKWAENGIWAFPANNYLGGRNVQDTLIRMEAPEAYYQGSCLIPPRGSHVWIIFEKGDVSHPFYTGSAEYGDCVAPPENQIGKEYQKKWTLLKTPDGKCLIASDDPSDARFELTGKKRLIKNPPFGDVDSVYKIDENQTVFLIDEREGHEKVLLKDYTGNFMKLVQNENEDAGKFFMHTNNDMEIDCGGDFYLSVTGDIHIRAQNVFITALENIENKAYLQLKEYSQSFDRYSKVYDRTLSGNVDIVSNMSINMQAASKLYQASLINIRNCTTISDVASGNISSAAGGFNSINAGGKVMTFGKCGTAIQCKNPTFAVISNSVSYPTYAEDAYWALPDGERYQEIETDRDPILELDAAKDSLEGFKIKHEPVNVSQPADAGVGTQSNESAMNNTQDGGDDDSDSIDSSSQNDSSDSENSSSSSTSSQTSSDQSNSSESSSSGSCSSGTVLSDITNNLQQENENEVYSYNGSNAGLTTTLVSFTDNLRDYAYSRVAGVGFGLEVGVYIGSDGLFAYDTGNYWNVRSMGMIGNAGWYNRTVSKCCDNISECLCYDVSYDHLTCKETTEKIYKDIDEDYNYLITTFIKELKETLTTKLPVNLNDYISITSSQQFDCVEGIINTVKKGKSVKEYLYSFIKNFCYNVVNKALTETIRENYIDFQNKVSDILSKTQNITEKDKKEYSEKFVGQVKSKIVDSTAELKKNLVSATKLSIDDDDKLILSDTIDKSIDEIKAESEKIVNKFNNSIEDFKEDSDLIDTLINEFIEKCKNILSKSTLDDEKINKVLNELSTQFDNKINDALYDVDKISIPNDIFYDSFAKINSEFEKVSFDILKTYDNFKTSLVLKFSDRIYDVVIGDVNSIVIDIDKYCANYKDNDTQFINTLKDKVKVLLDSIKNSLSKDDLLKNCLSESEIIEILDDFKKRLESVFVTKDNDTITEIVDESLNDVVVSIEKNRKSIVNNSIKVEDYNDGVFSKYNAIDYNTVPDDAGFGYKYLLFLNDKYRKTIAPLTLKCGGNVVAFDIISNTALIDEMIPFINQAAVNDYNSIFENIDNIDTNTIWWSNLKDIASQCSMLGIKMVITLCDFSDSTNPFIFNKNKQYVYTDKGWDDNIQGKFFKTVFDVVSQYGGEVIYNIGRHSYSNPYDSDNKLYNMYPNCGYLRKLINYFVYTCGISSNNLSLTSNEDENLYYYNPYTEYHSYDDDVQHKLDEHAISISDYVDGKTNDNASTVTYSTNNIGGYAGYLIKCDKDSVCIFNMDNLSENLPAGTDVNDPNIMNGVFCKHSREAVRYFKTKDYFENTSSLEFDLSGEVK